MSAPRQVVHAETKLIGGREYTVRTFPALRGGLDLSTRLLAIASPALEEFLRRTSIAELTAAWGRFQAAMSGEKKADAVELETLLGLVVQVLPGVGVALQRLGASMPEQLARDLLAETWCAQVKIEDPVTHFGDDVGHLLEVLAFVVSVNFASFFPGLLGRLRASEGTGSSRAGSPASTGGSGAPSKPAS